VVEGAAPTVPPATAAELVGAAETPGDGALEPAPIAAAPADVVVPAVPFVVDAGVVPVGVGMLESAVAVAGGVPDGVRMPEVAVVGAAPVVVPAGWGAVGMKKLLEPRPLPV
jgi:hypothetical protein